MAFALLFNLYKYLRSRAERRVCLIVLGVDNAGKTTLINSLQGETVRKDVGAMGCTTGVTPVRARLPTDSPPVHPAGTQAQS